MRASLPPDLKEPCYGKLIYSVLQQTKAPLFLGGVHPALAFHMLESHEVGFYRFP